MNDVSVTMALSITMNVYFMNHSFISSVYQFTLYIPVNSWIKKCKTPSSEGVLLSIMIRMMMKMMMFVMIIFINSDHNDADDDIMKIIEMTKL